MDSNIGDFLGFLGQALKQRTFAPTPPEAGKGLRPQDDPTTRLIINALRGDPQRGMGPAQPGQASGLDISPQRIIQSALMSPGTIPVYMRPQSADPGLQGQLESGLKGTTISQGAGPANVNLYPERQTQEGLYNTLPHELIHAMRMNQQLNTGGSGLEEALAYYGTGSPMAAWMSQLGNFQNPERQQPMLDQLLQSLLSEAPPTTPSQGLPQLPIQ